MYLPIEIVEIIFNYLTLKELIELLKVNRLYRHLSINALFQKNEIIEFINQIETCIKEYNTCYIICNFSKSESIKLKKYKNLKFEYYTNANSVIITSNFYILRNILLNYIIKKYIIQDLHNHEEYKITKLIIKFKN